MMLAPAPAVDRAGSPAMAPLIAPDPRILVIEDDEDLRSMIVEFLHEEGYDVAGRGDTISGLVRLMAVGADLLVLDWKMSGLDGFDLLETLRRCYPHVPVIFTTAYASEEIGGRALAAGAFSFLPKPFRRDELITHVSRAIRSRGSAAEGARDAPEPSR
jgi:DNA-binding response OmpR family regulator